MEIVNRGNKRVFCMLLGVFLVSMKSLVCGSWVGNNGRACGLLSIRVSCIWEFSEMVRAS